MHPAFRAFMSAGLLLLLAGPVGADAPNPPIRLWPDRAPGEQGAIEPEKADEQLKVLPDRTP